MPFGSWNFVDYIGLLFFPEAVIIYNYAICYGKQCK